MIVHHQPLVFPVHKDIRAGDVAETGRLVQLQRARGVDGPRPFQPIGIGQADVLALVVAEVEIILPQPVGQPLWHADQRWAVDVLAHTRVEGGCDNWVLREAADVH